MPQQPNQPGTSQVPGQQEGKMGQWSPTEPDPNAQKRQQENPEGVWNKPGQSQSK